MAEKVTVHYPEYYRLFSCINAGCEHTCCASWRIRADSVSLKRYRKEKGEFRKRLREGIDIRNGLFRMQDGKCSFLNGENLCDMYVHMGKESLCKICREFPRHVEDYGFLQEVSLSLACPEAARLILSGENQDLYMKMKTVREVCPIEDTELLDFLLKMRDVCFYILDYGTVPGQTEKPSVWLKTAMILSLAHDVQRHIRQGEEWPEDVLGRYTKKGAFKRFSRQLARSLETKKAADLSLGFAETFTEISAEIEKLNPVSPEWRELLTGCRSWVENGIWKRNEEDCRTEDRMQAENEPQERISGSILSEVLIGCLLRYYLYCWLPGSVYDGEPFIQVKMAVVSVILAEMACRYLRWQEGNETESGKDTGLKSGREFAPKSANKSDLKSDREFLVYASHFWARELEHSDENLEMMEFLMKTGTVFRFERLLNCLLFLL